jgi:tetratricopeptide (TPR) repeat protein
MTDISTVEARAEEANPGLRSVLAREPVLLILLALAAVCFFLAVSGIARIYNAQQRALGSRWFTRGVTDLKARNFTAAVNEFRAALRYSQDDYSYQFNLAEALVGLNRTGEAYAYLINLWDRQPEDGQVNLELARIAAGQGQSVQALRYYHNAIYAIWSGNQESERHDARLELIEYLLRNNARPQAQSELIALAAGIGDDPKQQTMLGNLFLRADDYEHALAAFARSLQSNSTDAEALAGAGFAALKLGHFDAAQNYLREAVAADPGDTQSAARLKTTQAVLQMDPFRPNLSDTQRSQIVLEAFATAGQRLKSCPASGTAAATAARAALDEQWARLRPDITANGLRNDPDLVERAMDVVFNIERESSTTCGDPSGADQVLLLIAQLRATN